MAKDNKGGNGLDRSARDQIRDKILGHKQHFKTSIISLFGAEIELRQPTLGQILDVQEGTTTKEAIIKILIQYSYVPGTNEKVFDTGDEAGLLALPYGKDLSTMNEAIRVLTDINILGEEKNSVSTPKDATSS